jgi:hypothetical protein
LLFAIGRFLPDSFPLVMKMVSSPRANRSRPAAEALEARIAPAATFTFMDVDGDTVTITTSQGTDAQLTAAALLAPSGVGMQLQALQLADLAAFSGANVTIDAVQAGAGDGFVNVGYIDATNIDLGKVVVDGDLGRIDVGHRSFPGAGVNALDVQSLGSLGLTTQAAGGTLLSNVKGSLGTLTVHGNVTDAQIEVVQTIKHIAIEGSLIGGLAEKSGSIRAGGNVSDVTIGGMIVGGGGFDSGRLSSGSKLSDATITGGIVGGTGENSGQLASRHQLVNITVSGGITGGSGVESGALATSGTLKKVTINGDITGGLGVQSGELAATGVITAVELNGSLLGGAGVQSGSMGSENVTKGVHVTGNVTGGTGASSGQIVSKGTVTNVTVDGSLIGGGNFETGTVGSLNGVDRITIGTNIVAGTGERSGLIVCDARAKASIGSVTILGSILGTPLTGIAGVSSGGLVSGDTIDSVEITGNIVGGNTADAGSIRSLNGIRNVIVHGNIEGGSADNSGSIHSTFKLGDVTVDGDLRGGEGIGSGAILSDTNLTSVTIHGSIIGGDGDSSGRIETDGDGAAGNVGKIVVDGSVLGGAGLNSGLIFSSGSINSIELNALTGGAGVGSGAVASSGKITRMSVAGNVTGGTALDAGKISSGSDIKRLEIGGVLDGGGAAFGSLRGGAGDIGQVFAGGKLGTFTAANVVGGAGVFSAQIRAASIDSITITGGLQGGGGQGSGAIIAFDGDIGSVEITGQIQSGSGLLSGHIGADRNINSVEFGAAVGNQFNPVLITAGGVLGAKNDSTALAIKSITAADSTSFLNVLAGYDIDANPVNPDVLIGTVTVGTGTGTGNWTATNVIAGAQTGDDNQFGTADDTMISATDSTSLLSQIARVIINGTITLPPSGQFSGSFGIVAEHVVAVSVGGTAVSLQKGPQNDFLQIGTTKDTSVFEVQPVT